MLVSEPAWQPMVMPEGEKPDDLRHAAFVYPVGAEGYGEHNECREGKPCDSNPLTPAHGPRLAQVKAYSRSRPFQVLSSPAASSPAALVRG